MLTTSTEINLPARIKKMDHLINIDDKIPWCFSGRMKELQKMRITFNKRVKNNVLIIGKPGVGKTSLVEAFAHENSIKNIFVVECAKLIGNTEYRGAFENKVTELLSFAKEMDLILFFDEIHALVDLGRTTGGMSITDILKPYLLDDSLVFIGATTPKESNMLLDDEAFKRRFATIWLGEPDEEELMQMKKTFEEKVLKETILDENETKDVIVVLTSQLEHESFPDKLLDFVDHYYAYNKTMNRRLPYRHVLEDYIYDKRLGIHDKKC